MLADLVDVKAESRCVHCTASSFASASSKRVVATPLRKRVVAALVKKRVVAGQARGCEFGVDITSGCNYAAG